MLIAMPNISRKHLADIRRTVNLLIEVLDAIDDSPPVISEETSTMVAAKVRDRICLACGSQIPPNEKTKRGLEITCYNTLRSRIRRGETTESQLIRDGKMTAEPVSPGRVSKIDKPRSD